MNQSCVHGHEYAQCRRCAKDIVAAHRAESRVDAARILQLEAQQRAAAGRIAACEFRRVGSGAVTACTHVDGSSEFIKWDSVEQALQAGRVLFDRPCGRRCQMRHSVIAYGQGVWQVASPPQPEPTREELFRTAYPGALVLSVELLPAPPSLNEPLTQPQPQPCRTGAVTSRTQAASRTRGDNGMSLHEAASAARERADVSLDPCVHAVDNALQAAVAAEMYALDRSLDPEPDTTGIPPWPVESLYTEKPPDPGPGIPGG